MESTIVLGPPGTGKTSYLLKRIEELLASGVSTREIALLTFTRRASAEAIGRITQKFSKSKKDFPWVRTIHSLAYHMIGAGRNSMLRRKDLIEVGKLTGVDFSWENLQEESDVLSNASGDRLLFLENLARITQRTLKSVWEEYSGLDSWSGFSYETLAGFAHTYEHYKRMAGKIDYTDSIEKFNKQGIAPPVKYLFVDEGQDLSSLQWAAVNMIKKRAEKVWIAGDDDQAIYGWCGADVDTFLALEGKEEVLHESHRMPKAAYDLAVKITARIKHRRAKDFTPRTKPHEDYPELGTEGKLIYDQELADLDMRKGKWLLLARHGYQLDTYERYCREEGLLYRVREAASNTSRAALAVITWERLRRGDAMPADQVADAVEAAGHRRIAKGITEKLGSSDLDKKDVEALGCSMARVWHEALVEISDREREYFLMARRQGEKLLQEPRIQINTIHGAKGGESPSVVLLPDISDATFGAIQKSEDTEARVFYVAVSRTIDTLHVLAPQTGVCYDLGGE